MPYKHKHILLIDDDPSHAKALETALLVANDGASNLEWVRTLSTGLERLASKTIWAIFLNLSLPDSTGVDTLDSLLLLSPTAPVIVIAGVDEEGICQTAMLHGAQDYLLAGHLDTYAFARALRNIAENEAARHELFNEKERAQVTLNSIGDAVLSTDISGNVTYLNVVAEHMTGWTMKEAAGHALKDVFHIIDGVTRMPSPNPADLAIQQNKAVGLSANCILIRRDGHESAIEDSSAPIHERDGQITGAVIVFHDVSMARSMVLQMSHLARHDVLTDLPNRLMLNDRITQAISLAQRKRHQLAVLFLDLDGFKRINDSLGHSVGDKILQTVATRLQACVRKSDTVSRQGGDEFVILLPEVTHAADAAVSAAKILTEIKDAYNIGEHTLRLTGSIGISTYPEHGKDAESLIKNADTAMYHAKDKGRDNCQFFRPDMSVQAVERQSLEGQLRYAVERRELVLYYQPKINLDTGAITGVEALVRWQHPQRGLLLPGEFLAIAEDSGIIVAIGHWVLHEACRQTREWLDAGLPAVPVAVNISSLEFQSEHFLDGVQDALKSASLDAKYLELEITESVLMRDAGSTAVALGKLKAMGVRLVADDFGTGFSSLSYLTRFPFDALKLDRSFVRNMMTSSNDAIVVSAVINMGSSLKHMVIAEGVETREQLAFLQLHQCPQGQGYYFGRPAASDQFARSLDALPQQASGTNGAIPFQQGSRIHSA